MDELMSKQEEVTELEISHALKLSYSLDYIPGLLRWIYSYRNLSYALHLNNWYLKSICISELLSERCELWLQW